MRTADLVNTLLDISRAVLHPDWTDLVFSWKADDKRRTNGIWNESPGDSIPSETIDFSGLRP
jgi:hypothetical protein